MRRALGLVLGLCAGVACDGATSDPGLAARFRVEGASYVEGPLPAEGDGPRVTALELTRSRVTVGSRGNVLRGGLETGARAVLLALEGDVGHWVLPAAPPDMAAPEEPTFDVLYELASTTAPGPIALHALAVDGAGRFGAVRSAPLEAEAPGLVTGELVVRLEWDRNADLDLHVVDPAGVEIWARNLSSYTRPRPGEPSDPDALLRAGVLDVDSNAACVIDGRRVENVVWKRAPPVGGYTVRVDTPSLCGESSARWRVSVTRSGTMIAEARGLALDVDTRGEHNAGAGVLALTFEVTE